MRRIDRSVNDAPASCSLRVATICDSPNRDSELWAPQLRAEKTRYQVVRITGNVGIAPLFLRYRSRRFASRTDEWICPSCLLQMRKTSHFSGGPETAAHPVDSAVPRPKQSQAMYWRGVAFTGSKGLEIAGGPRTEINSPSEYHITLKSPSASRKSACGYKNHHLRYQQQCAAMCFSVGKFI